MDPDKDAEGKGSEVSFVKRWTEENECYEEIAEYIKEVNEILDFIKPFPRDGGPDHGQTVSRSSSTESDHLGNLIKLVEQLKELKEKDSKMNERTQYLKELKKLRERKKLLKYEAEVGTSGHCSQEEKTRSSMPFRKTSRGRSKSVNMDEIRRGRFPEEEQRRKLSAGSQKTEKSKVSKWTKVKEAFRWEKASVDGKIARREDVHYLQVPLDKTPESLSDSPLSGQVSGSSSVGAASTSCLAVSSGYSGEHSSEGHSTSSGCGMDLPPPPPPLPTEEDFLMLPLIQDLSSSSSSEKLDELITYSELLSKGNDGGTDLVTDSFEGAFHPAEDLDARRSKSLDGDAILGPNSPLMQHLSKDSLTFPKKTHKTAWGKVKDIIQTRKDSLKKKQKKRTVETFSSQSALDFEGQEDPSPPEDKPKEPTSPKPRIELTESAEEGVISQTKPISEDSVAKRRLTPVLTITLPSTEELRSISSAEGDTQKPNIPEETAKSTCDNVESTEDIPKYEKSKTVHYHHFSKWSKVKRAFLTNPSRSSEFIPEANSVPSSPNKQMSFFSDVESDELSSGDWTDYKTNVQDKRNIEAESPGCTFSDDIHKNYLSLNNKLTQEFDQKMREWERLKSEMKTKPDGLQKQKSEDWGKTLRVVTRQRESMAIPLPKLEELSPEFKKKLDEWKKIKKSQTISAVPGTSPKDEAQGQNFKMRIGEWQRWRPRGNHKMSKSEQNEEFAKKLEEWQRIKGSVRRSRSQSDRGKEEGNRTPSPSLKRKNSKKKTGSGKSSGTESLGGSLKEKDGRSSRKQQKEKDMQWLEKELHKIERGKMRLEREKEKFLEREARLEKMKRTMGTTSPTEILVKTPTGFFRFEGISQKFQKKLYEWEKARGIAPEASTFALLEEYASKTERDEHRSNGMSLQRSKSMGSVIEVSSIAQNMPHHPSSLSLNDVDELEVAGMGESRASSDPTLGQEEDEPQAIIVDVEDVVEETAALMADVPKVREEVPVYSYAPREVTHLIDSSGSDNEAEIQILGQTIKPDDTETTDITCRRVFGWAETEEKRGVKHLQPRIFPDGLDQQQAVTRVHELSSQLLTLAEKLELAFSERSLDGRIVTKAPCNKRMQEGDLNTDESPEYEDVIDPLETRSSLQELAQLPTLITSKVLELRSGLNVLKNAAEPLVQESVPIDLQVKQENLSDPDRIERESKRQKQNEEEGSPRSLQKSKAQVLFGESAEFDYDKRAKNSPELIKKKIKEKISLMQRMTTEPRPRNFKPFEFDATAVERDASHVADEKVVIVQNNSREGNQKKLLKTRRVTDTTIAYRQIAEGKRDESCANSYGIPLNSQKNLEDGSVTDKTPVNVFVPTTRKIISPVRRDSKGTTSILSYIIDDVAPKVKEENPKPLASPVSTRKVEAEKATKDIGIPPLPSSPLSLRKATSPGIRSIIAKYSQKIEASDGGSISPAWRSPVLDRKEVHKSASVGIVDPPKSEVTKGIIKSSSAGAMQTPEPSERALRLKKAKEEFLARGPGEGTVSMPSTPTAECLSNRLSHVSIGSEYSFDGPCDSNLIKSASAGMINAEDSVGRSSDVDDLSKPKSSLKFSISSIKSRFRKVRLKRGKERGGAVSTLCRQSLLLEVPVEGESANMCTSKSCPSSPVLERSKSRTDTWLCNPAKKMFGGKETKPEL